MKKTDYEFVLDGYTFFADFEITANGCEIEKVQLNATHDFQIEIVKDEQLTIIRNFLNDKFDSEIELLKDQDEFENKVDAAERSWEAKNDY
jgi:hypothetical protein